MPNKKITYPSWIHKSKESFERQKLKEWDKLIPLLYKLQSGSAFLPKPIRDFIEASGKAEKSMERIRKKLKRK